VPTKNAIGKMGGISLLVLMRFSQELHGQNRIEYKRTVRASDSQKSGLSEDEQQVAAAARLARAARLPMQEVQQAVRPLLCVSGTALNRK
jgi:hypothetical protein